MPTYKTLESKLHYGKKNTVFVTSSMLLFFLLFCSSLFVVIMFPVWCDRPEIILKEPVDVENTWSTTHLFVIGNNKNGKVFVTWNISHGRSIIFHKMKKKKMHVQLNDLNEKYDELCVCRFIVRIRAFLFICCLIEASFFGFGYVLLFYIIRIFFTIQNESKLSFEKSAALIIRLLASPLG